MAREPQTYDLYGQPDDEYDIYRDFTFAETKLKTEHISGFKLHVTVATGQHDQLARGILPTLRALHTHHKVVLPFRYATFNTGVQAGKFITVYAGPEEPAQDIVDAIDPVLVALRNQGINPGPVPMARPSNHTEMELPIGRSGMIRWLWLQDLKRG
ncbi:hypothetical protein FHP25_27680 [Vineibacter terrae]|uniref:Uncharacterized protein n=1 Tax=Vineibacter terrae TaxID=2586908 RepID=A0A5C8PE03_9HYPH|nr:hypothetical protein [Vineibacter terrae]TXL72016.1 hypothetical protein FHP25_27680 [Vineibacter terrae]